MRSLVAIALAGLLLGIGCAKPGPSQQAIAQADYALRQAREQGADTEAAALMRSADEKLARAEALQRDKKYDEAQRLAEQVAVEASLADALTRNRVAKAQLEDSEAVLRELREEAERRRRF